MLCREIKQLSGFNVLINSQTSNLHPQSADKPNEKRLPFLSGERMPLPIRPSNRYFRHKTVPLVDVQRVRKAWKRFVNSTTSQMLYMSWWHRGRDGTHCKHTVVVHQWLQECHSSTTGQSTLPCSKKPNRRCGLHFSASSLCTAKHSQGQDSSLLGQGDYPIPELNILYTVDIESNISLLRSSWLGSPLGQQVRI